MNHYEQLRYERNLTQSELAEKAGLSRPTIIRLEKNDGAKPSPAVAHVLADFYGITVRELLGLDPRIAA